MPAQVCLHDPHHAHLHDLRSDQPTHTFLWHSFEEIVAIAVECRRSGAPVLVFAHRTATAVALTGHLTAAGLTVELAQGRTSADERQEIIDRFHAGTTGVLVATDALAVGWRAPHRTLVLHAELPPLTSQFTALMGQRQARVPAEVDAAAAPRRLHS